MRRIYYMKKAIKWFTPALFRLKQPLNIEQNILYFKFQFN